MLDCWLNMMTLQRLAGTPPTILPSIRPENIELTFVRPHNAFPLVQLPLSVSERKVITCLTMFLSQQRLLMTNTTMQTSSPQYIPYATDRNIDPPVSSQVLLSVDSGVPSAWWHLVDNYAFFTNGEQLGTTRRRWLDTIWIVLDDSAYSGVV